MRKTTDVSGKKLETWLVMLVHADLGCRFIGTPHLPPAVTCFDRQFKFWPLDSASR